jgi:26S proteasome regulatory subunit N5
MIASYVVLAKYDNEQSDMLYKLDADPAMKKVPLHQCVLSLLVSIRSAAPRVLTRPPPFTHPPRARSDLLKSFTTPELKRWPAIESLYGPTLRQSSVFDASKKGQFRWEELHKRVIEHVSRPTARGSARGLLVAGY